MSRPPLHQTQLRRQLFISCGLSEKEASLYDMMLSLGTASGAEIEKKSGLKKNTYALLTSLEKKRLVLKFQKDGKTVFQPAPPTALSDLVDRMARDISQTRTTLETVLPELSSAYGESVGKPTVRYFEGMEGLREVFSDVYDPGNRDVHGCADLEVVDTVFPGHILNDLIPERQKHGIRAWALLAQSEASREVKTHDAEHLRTTVLLDKTRYPLPAEIEVYRDRVAMMSFAKNRFMALIIENEDFAVSLRSIMQWVIDAGTGKHHP